jgi:hypothetical protein
MMFKMKRLLSEKQSWFATPTLKENEDGFGRTEDRDMRSGKLAKRKINWRSLEFDGINPKDYPDFSDAYVTYAEYADGTPLSESEIEKMEYEQQDEVYDALMNFIN